MIEIVGIRHFFDLDVHDNRSLRPFLFDSTIDADQFLSILALLPQPLPFDANVRRLTGSTFGLETLYLNEIVRNGRLSSNSRYPPSTSYPATTATTIMVHGSWFWFSPSSLSVSETIDFESRQHARTAEMWWRGKFVRTTFNRCQMSR